ADAVINFHGRVDLAGQTFHLTGPGERWFYGDFIMNGGTIVTDGAAPLSFGDAVGATFDGTFQFVHTDPLAAQDSFDLIDGISGVNDVFTAILLPQLGPRLIWDTTAFYTDG